MFQNIFLRVSFMALFAIQTLTAQKINSDSLLLKVIDDIKQESYESAIQKARLGIKIAPDYLDFHLFLGRGFEMTQQKDSAAYYYRYVIERNPVYKDAFIYLFNMQVADNQYEEAHKTIDQAIVNYPQEKDFYLKKRSVYQLQSDDAGEYAYLQSLSSDIKSDSEVQQRLYYLELKNKNDRLGVFYSLTAIDRDNVGPWHLGSIQYVRERSWGSLIGRFSYANRFSSGSSVLDGVQYELESYFFTGKKSYSYVGAAYSDDIIFQKWRLGYSYYQNFNKGWETELGIRYTKVPDEDFVGYVGGIGKYFGPYWINLRHIMNTSSGQYYPTFTLTGRLYTGTRFDYYSVSMGFGTQPEDPIALGLFGQRVSLDSYRIGAGYNKIFAKKYFFGVNFNYNNQEFLRNRTQNEFEITLSLQYKF
jgi:YaiO family outer membrane protein